MDFYHDLITQKSWQVLQDLRRSYDFILIGGWAVFLYTHALKSKDIDLVCDFEELEKFKEKFGVVKNDRLQKYEARQEEVEIDIYVPFYSNPGIPAEDLSRYAARVEGFGVPSAEILAILKMKALRGRSASPKGRKDLVDLLSLFKLAEFDFSKLQSAIARYNLEELLVLAKKAISQTGSLDELDLNTHKMARLKRQIFNNLGEDEAVG